MNIEKTVTQRIHAVHKTMKGKTRPKAEYDSIYVKDPKGEDGVIIYGWRLGDVMLCHLGVMTCRLLHVPTMYYFFQHPVLSFTSDVLDLLTMAEVDFHKVVTDGKYRFEVNQALLDRMPGMVDGVFLAQHYHHSPNFKNLKRYLNYENSRRN